MLDRICSMHDASTWTQWIFCGELSRFFSPDSRHRSIQNSVQTLWYANVSLHIHINTSTFTWCAQLITDTCHMPKWKCIYVNCLEYCNMKWWQRWLGDTFPLNIFNLKWCGLVCDCGDDWIFVSLKFTMIALFSNVDFQFYRTGVFSFNFSEIMMSVEVSEWKHVSSEQRSNEKWRIKSDFYRKWHSISVENFHYSSETKKNIIIIAAATAAAKEVYFHRIKTKHQI